MTDETRMATAAKTAAREGAETERRKDEAPLIRIVDDDGDLRDALLYMLSQEGWEAVAFPDAESFLRSAAPSAPGVLILDVRMPGMSGIELRRELRRRGFEQPVIFLTAHGDIDMAVEELRHGAFHFLQKPLDPEKLLSAVAQAVEADRRKRLGMPPVEEIRARIASLRPREREVMALLAQGFLNADIAARLGLSVRTVEAHRAAAYVKLQVKNAAEAAQLWAAAAESPED